MILNDKTREKVCRAFMILYARAYFFKQGYRNGGLPCWHCRFIIADKLEELGPFYPIWINCTNPEYGGVENAGCNWGEV